MSQSAIKPSEIPLIFLAIILLALIANGYLDQYQWILWLIILAIPTWLIYKRQKPNLSTW